MKGFLAVARREIGERRLVITAAAFASLLPLGAPVVHGLSGVTAQEARSAIALFLCLAFAGGIAVGLGATIVVPSIGNRRIGFDFARPVSAFDIWGGRISATLLLAVVTGIIVWIPSRLAGPLLPWNDLFANTGLPAYWPLLALGCLLALYSLLHAVTLAFRSRSVVLLLDAVFLLAATFGTVAAISHLVLAFAEAPLARVLVFLPIAALAALLCAGYASIARGRTDLGAAHRASSLVLWTMMGAAILAANGYASWVTSARPANLGDLWATPAANGPWVDLAGSARGAQANFFYDTTTGRFARLTVNWRGPVLSRDGKRGAWVLANPRGGPFPVWTWRLDDPHAKPVATRILLPGYPSVFELSADGSRLATMEEGILSIHDIASEKTAVSAHVSVGDRRSVEGLFVGNDRFRIYRTEASTFDILELDLSTRALSKVGAIPILNDLRYLVPDPTGSRVIAVDGPIRRMRLFDGRTGELFATLADTPAEGRWPVFLSGGRIAVIERSSEGLRLLVFGGRGERRAAIPLPSGSQASIGGEIEPGRLVVGIADPNFHYASWLVDLDAASTRKIADDLRPVRSLWTSIETGSDATKLFYGPGQRSLVHLDPLTGERKVLLGTGP